MGTTRERAGFWESAWFAARAFAGGSIVAAGFGAAIAVLSAVIGGIYWMVFRLGRALVALADLAGAAQ